MTNEKLDLLYNKLGISKNDVFARTFMNKLLFKRKYKEFLDLVLDSLEKAVEIENKKEDLGFLNIEEDDESI